MTRSTDTWGEARHGLRTRIAFEDDAARFRRGKPVVVNFAVQNVSDEPQIVMHLGFWPNHRLLVTNPRGDACQRTDTGNKTNAVYGTDVFEKTVPVTLQPQEIDDAWEPVDLVQLFVLDSPGEYTAWYLFDARHDEPVQSNRVVFQIVE